MNKKLAKLVLGIVMEKMTDKSAVKSATRKALIEQRLNLPDRLQRAALLQSVMRIWLFDKPDTIIGAYCPSKENLTLCLRCTAGKKMQSRKVQHRNMCQRVICLRLLMMPLRRSWRRNHRRAARPAKLDCP